MSRVTLTLFLLVFAGAARAAGPDYQRQIEPILTKFCAGCHNAQDREGDLSVESFADLQQGGGRGPALVPGKSAESRLWRVLTGETEPRMPPEDSEQPTAADIALLRAWIEAGAAGPQRDDPRPRLVTPHIEPLSEIDRRITALAYSAELQQLAVARFQRVELQGIASGTPSQVIEGLPGKVNAVHFVAGGERLLTASGVTGLYGQATLWNSADGTPLREFTGHRDILFDAELSPDGQVLATCGYDRQVILWDANSGEILRTLSGHNDAIYDLAFSPDGTVLATASGDETVKLWQVTTGERLDTLSQPQAEQYAVAFSPDGRFVLAGGADNRIRVWQFLSRSERRINPLAYARFAHESAVVGIAFSDDGEHLVSTAEDRSLKLWETAGFTQTHLYESQPDVVTGLAVLDESAEVLVARVDGSTARYPLAAPPKGTAQSVEQVGAGHTAVAGSPNRLMEHEPNDLPDVAMRLYVPAQVDGTIDASGRDASGDADLFRFSSRADEEWVLEVTAAQQKSPLDSKLEVLSSTGEPIERVKLQAIRDSYFKFRGKDSSTSDDFRVHNWQEMELNEYLYANGEVVKLFLYPRGPDSGFQVYPGRGKRYTYFETTAMSHALHEPCYIVQPHAPQAELIPNGLPTFHLYYENDDDGRRELGSDSRLSFRAPADGEYLARISDARGFEGTDFTYQLLIRRRQPDFEITLHGKGMTVPAGSGQEFSIEAKRIDGFDGDIQIDVEHLPPGFHASTPLVIQAGHTIAFGTIYADRDAKQPSADAAAARLSAHATVGGRVLQKEPHSFGELKLGEEPKLFASVLPAEPEESPVSIATDRPLELVIAPGQTITAKVRVQRNDVEGPIGFGKADAGRNLPHGVYVDNIGLNGLLIVEGQSERTFFITAADWVPETTRLFHLRTEAAGNVTTRPVLLRVQK